MNYTYLQIISELGIRISKDKPKNNWLQCHCISGLHKDENPSMGIHLNTGIIHCFSCGYKTNLYKLIQEKLNCSYKEAIDYIHGVNYNKYVLKDPIQNLKPVNEIENKVHEMPRQNYPFVSIPLTEPEKYNYTKLRGYTKKYCKEFNIQIALSGLYENYIITPIIDIEQQFISYEARKLVREEKLKSYFEENIHNTPKNISLHAMEEMFKYIIKTKKENNTELTQDEKWLRLNKVLYPSGHKVNITIFNIDNLKFNEDLILFEGMATHPKIYQYISKNCTTIFGANVSREQIKILRSFKKDIIVISDNDSASFQLINRLSSFIPNIKGFDCITDEKYDEFIDKIKNANIITASEFYIKNVYSA